MEQTTSSYFYFFAQSNGDPKETDNTSENFAINLNRPLILKGDWEVAVISYKSGAYNKLYYLCSDFIESSLVNAVQLPLLKIIYEKPSATLLAKKFKQNGNADGTLQLLYQQPATEGIEYRLEYHTVGKKDLTKIRFFLVDEQFAPNQPIGDKTSLLLHFRRKMCSRVDI